MPTIKEKIIDVFQNRIGEEFDRGEIIDLVVNKYPETNRGSVIPSDYCYNMVNTGINFNIHFFESLGEREGRYRCIGQYKPYNGSIYWKPIGATCEQVGDWEAGRFRLWDNAPPNLLRRYGVDQWIDPRK
ncbi:MAG: hypothetical protein ABIG94_06465 [Pseudomonadota bacterium]